jgi:hypothetical protein
MTQNITYINHPSGRFKKTGHISQKALNKLHEDGILNAETCMSEKDRIILNNN